MLKVPSGPVTARRGRFALDDRILNLDLDQAERFIVARADHAAAYFAGLYLRNDRDSREQKREDPAQSHNGFIILRSSACYP